MGKNKRKKAKRMEIYERLDYQHLLTRQNPSIKFKVVYLRSATHLAACVINNQEFMNSSELKKPMIIDSTLYYYETDDEEEAYYLVAILNSTILDELIKPLQSKGFAGAPRDIHKKPLEFPIPKYDPANKIHVEIAKLGKTATKKARGSLPKMLRAMGYDRRLKMRGTLTPIEVANLRRRIRSELMKEISQIDELVTKLLGVRKGNPNITIDYFLK